MEQFTENPFTKRGILGGPAGPAKAFETESSLNGIVKLRTAERSWAERQPSPSFFKAHTSPLSSQRTLGPGGVDGELL